MLVDGSEVRVVGKAFSLLEALMDRAGELVTKDELFELVWPGVTVSESVLTTAIKEIRQAIGDDARNPAIIQTVYGRGYRFVPEVRRGTDLLQSGTPAIQENQRVQFCAARDGTNIAYSVVGQGPLLVKTANWLNHLEFEWESPIWRHWLRELSSRNTLLRYDERGNGLSDWKVADLSFEAMVNDLETVVDAAGAERFDLLAISQGCSVAVVYANRHPERVRRMVLIGGYAAGWRVRSDPAEVARREAMLTLTEAGWGQNNPAFRQLYTTLYFPEATAEEADWFNELQRISTSPVGARRLQETLSEIDVREELAKVRVPTLVMHARSDAVIPFEAGRAIAARIPGARLVALESKNHLILEHEPAWPALVANLRAFLDAQE